MENSSAISASSNPAKVSEPPDGEESTANATPEEKKLSGAELKKLRQAAKAAKRQSKGVGAQGQDAGAAQDQGAHANQQSKEKASNRKSQQMQSLGQGKSQPNAQVTEPRQAKTRDIPFRRRPSTTAPALQPSVADKKVALFGHLYTQPRRHGIAGASKEVHPAVLALGLQMSSYEVCGSTARCVAMLLVFKNVIKSYSTPKGTSLARDLVSHYLSPQIDYLRSCRPLSISMGNTIRYLKDVIVKIDPDVSEQEAKNSLLEVIDNIILDRVVAADELIKDYASKKIKNGDVILTYAKSSVVSKTLLEAKKNGTDFRVIVVDTKPWFEGKKLAIELAGGGVKVSYYLVSAAFHAVQQATQVFLGAHAMMGNGCLYSRVGTAVVAMLAHEREIPVIVCCETVKFTERVTVDSIVGNELAPPEELLLDGEDGGKLARDPAQTREARVQKWTGAPNLQILNIMFDVTPAQYITMVVTESGYLPPSSVPSVLRILEAKNEASS